MEIEEQIREQAFKENAAYKDIRDFVEKQEIVDRRSTEEAKKFDAKTVVLPPIRNTNDLAQEALFEKECGNRYFAAKDYKEALSCYEYGFSTTDMKLRAECYFNAGLCQQKLENEKLALENFEDALKADENYEKAKVKLAKHYIEEENISKAKALLLSCQDKEKVRDLLEQCEDKESSSDSGEEIAINRSCEPTGNLQNETASVQGEMSEKAQNDEKEQRQQEQEKSCVQEQEEEATVQPPVNELDYFISDSPNPLEFFSCYKELLKQNRLDVLVNRFSSQEITDYFTELKLEMSFQDLEGLFSCLLSSSIKNSKVINVLYGITGIDAVVKTIRMMPSVQGLLDLISINKKWVDSECEEDKREAFNEKLADIEEIL